MSDTPIFDPKVPHESRLRHEWVTIDGGRLCVREMTAADNLFVLERSTRTGREAADIHIDAGGIQLWQVVVCCYDGPDAKAKRIFDITDVGAIQGLKNRDWRKIQDAIERVNGLADEEVAALQDFTGAGAADFAATLPPGASSTSTASPAS